VKFVTFHIRLPERAKSVVDGSVALIDKSFVLRHLFSAERQSSAQHEMIAMCLRSARQWHPGCSLEILTDLTTQFECLPEGVQIVRFNLDATRVMFSRLQAQIQYLRGLSGHDTVVLLDSDMLVNGDLSELDHHDFALGVTIRDNVQMPVNGGLLVASGRRRAEAIDLLAQVLDFYSGRYTDQSVWWGDQLALRDLVLEHLGQGYDWTPTNSGSIWLLASEIYNYTPDYCDMYLQLSRRRSIEKVLHFKGGRKRLMRQYWRAFMNPESAPLDRTGVRMVLKALAARQWVRRLVSSAIGHSPATASTLE
jgi:hypothetical protein